MRTTLIVVLAGSDGYGYAYLGDGGGVLVRANGTLEHFLKPMKGEASNLVLGSLGPRRQGEPVSGFCERRAGDFVLLGSDGVFDRVEASFPLTLARAAADYDGDLPRLAADAVEDLARFRDDAGFVCDDNLTLALACHGRPVALLGEGGPAASATQTARNEVGAGHSLQHQEGR